MIQNTRFNPTIAMGTLHLGHLAMILTNEAEAHSTGGRFLMRFDDNQLWWRLKLSVNQIDNFICTTKDDMDFFGVQVDEYSSQYALEKQMDDLLLSLNRGPLPIRKMVTNIVDCAHFNDATFEPPYPYAPWLTAEKVILDFMDQITLLIRGADLCTEASLYAYFCDLWGLSHPVQHYLTRLKLLDHGELSDVSKTRGNLKLCDLRQRYPSDYILDQLARAWLIDPRGPWLMHNVQRTPLLDPEVFE